MYYQSRRHTPDSWWLKMEMLSQKLPVRIALAGGMIAAAFLYVFQTNNVTASSYTVGQLNRDIKNLETENRQLEVKLAEIQSIARLSSELQGLGYVPVDTVEYAAVNTAVVAKR